MDSVHPADEHQDTLDQPDQVNRSSGHHALIELLFFAYRDFVGEPDAILSDFGFGRAHHRVLHFVNRHPGLTVAELLDILKITKQSLSRVLRALVQEGFVEQHPGTEDRRQRHLRLTAKGDELANRLLALQLARIEEALTAHGLGRNDRPLSETARRSTVTGHTDSNDNVTHDAVAEFLFGLIDAGERAKVRNRIESGRETNHSRARGLDNGGRSPGHE